MDASGQVYIADSHNNRIRMVSGATISTVAANGTAAYAGDGAAATSASLAKRSGVAIDAAGSLFIADTNNHRIRKVVATIIRTIAGNGEELFAGDGGVATVAALDSSTGVAVDTAGNVFIADRHNQRVRVVNSIGTISTVAGNTTGFGGGFAGDGGGSTSATLASPTAVAVDAAGSLYISDSNNQRIRQVTTALSQRSQATDSRTSAATAASQ